MPLSTSQSPAAALFAVRLYLPFALHCALLNISGTLNISYRISGNSNLSLALSPQATLFDSRRVSFQSNKATLLLRVRGDGEHKVSLSLAEIGFISGV